MSNPKQRGKSKYVGENRHPISLSRPDAGDDSRTEEDRDAPPSASETPTGANHARRIGIQVGQAQLGAILALGAVLVMVLVIVLLWAKGVQQPSPLQEAAAPTPTTAPTPAPTEDRSQVLLGEALPVDQQPQPVQQAVPTAAIPTVSVAPSAAPVASAAFRDFYEAHGGLNVLGAPLSEVLTVNGREIQWFERARIERWPEYAGTPYEIQLGRLGVEYTAGRPFSIQQFFVSQPELRFFAETGHALGGAFLTFWEQNGGVDVFGLPISEEFDEVLPDGKAYRVQYFERARLELHPEAGGTPYEVQAGLLGTALYRNENRPTTIQPVPTAVPLP